MYEIQENWVRIDNTFYEVSDSMYIRNIITGRILKPTTSKGGGVWNTISVNGKIQCINIPRLVVKLFFDK